VKVVDDSGQPVNAARIAIGYYVAPPPGETIATSSIKGETDANGIFSASGRTGSTDLFFSADKEGYYPVHLDYELAGLKKNDSAKWNPTITLLLKKIGAPIPMYAKQIRSLKVPKFNKPIGFDLMAGDWVAPYGKGINTDLFFTEKHLDENSGYILNVSFPNPGDGIQEFVISDMEKGSALRSPHEAPLDGYQPEVAQTAMTNPNRNFFFRVRTILDEKGNIKTAIYGKIYGDLAQFTYYLNPTSNDHNVEFDPKHDLLTGEQVTQP